MQKMIINKRLLNMRVQNINCLLHIITRFISFCNCNLLCKIEFCDMFIILNSYIAQHIQKWCCNMFYILTFCGGGGINIVIYIICDRTDDGEMLSFQCKRLLTLRAFARGIFTVLQKEKEENVQQV